jgi:acetyl esterase/lipase
LSDNSQWSDSASESEQVKDTEGLLLKEPKDGFNSKTHVQVRVISPKLLPLDFETGHMRYEEEVTFQGCCSTSNRPIKRFDKLIVHIHGGGFISMSSESHQTYTRIWANDLCVPIVSIDYRLAPDC